MGKDKLTSRCIIKLAFICSLTIATAASADVSGRARIVDGDTLVINEERIRLHGIDAPEQRQTCLNGNKEWACGVQSTDALERMIAERNVHCVGDKRDRYKRLIAVCYVGSLNLNKEMVSEGWAVIDSIDTTSNRYCCFWYFSSYHLIHLQ